MVYFQTPVPETSNRVIRQYSQYADRFLRVRFTEEKTEVLLISDLSISQKAVTDLYDRVESMAMTKTPKMRSSLE